MQMNKEELQQLSELIAKYRVNLCSRGYYRISSQIDDIQEYVDADVEDLNDKGYLSCK